MDMPNFCLYIILLNLEYVESNIIFTALINSVLVILVPLLM